jgi:5-methylcytosine-specific restriction endonuclease McrA
LPVPTYFEESVDSFKKSVQELIDGNMAHSLTTLSESNAEKVKEFFIEHGQQSAYFRVRNRKEIDRVNKGRKKENSSPRLIPRIEKEVFARDNFHCRYCGLRIISKEVFASFSHIVGAENFSIQRKNSIRNGLTLGLRGVADHVEPYASGGETEIDNLVTSCYSCNFGKAGYTLEQLGIEDPRNRKPIQDNWSGLTEFLPALKSLEKVANR